MKISSSIKWILLCLLLMTMFVRSFHTADSKSATYDEAFFITYGYSLLKTGDYRLSIDKPPLVPLVSALPLIFVKPEFDTDDPDWKNSNLWIDSDEPWGGLSSYRWNLSLRFLHKNRISSDKIPIIHQRILIHSMTLELFHAGGVIFLLPALNQNHTETHKHPNKKQATSI